MTFKEWNMYFQNRTEHFDHIIYTDEMQLDGHEEKLITKAIQQFQKGEDSDGKHLTKLAEKMKDPNYTEAIKGLIKEEQNHAAALGKFMKQEKIPLIKKHFLDDIFKRFIRTPFLFLTIMILTCAEVVATIFYRALSEVTYSSTLQNICKQILVDEAMHLQFQGDALKRLYNKKNKIGQFFIRQFFMFLMICIAAVASWQYRKILTVQHPHFIARMHAFLHEFKPIFQIMIGKTASIAKTQQHAF